MRNRSHTTAATLCISPSRCVFGSGTKAHPQKSQRTVCSKILAFSFMLSSLKIEKKHILTVFHSIANFNSFCIIKLVKRTDKVSGNAADALKRHGFIFIAQINKFAIESDFKCRYDFVRIVLLDVIYILLLLFFSHFSACDSYLHLITSRCGVVCT